MRAEQEIAEPLVVPETVPMTDPSKINIPNPDVLPGPQA